MLEIMISDDYLKEGDIGFKKPKASSLSLEVYSRLTVYQPQTKKKRASRRAAADEPADTNGMDVDEKPIVPRERNLDDNFVDDDDLQAALTRSRRAKLHKSKKVSPEELAKKGQTQFLDSAPYMPLSCTS